jgi:hypothetical protein
MLKDILPARYRKAAYGVYALVGVVLGAIQVAYLNINGQPQWLTVALAVYGFVGLSIGATAASNTEPLTTGKRNERGAMNLGDAVSLDALQRDLAAIRADLERGIREGARAGTRAVKNNPPAAK